MNIPFSDLSRIHLPLMKQLRADFEEIATNSSFILGKKEEEFEKEYAAYEGSRFGIGVANGTDSLLLALKACGIGDGDEVITQSHTFIATALAITYSGAIPVFAEINPHSFTLDPISAESKITKKTKAILPVSLYGQPVDIEAFVSLAKHYKLKLIVDNAQAHGAKYKNKPLGIYGDACSYSFYPGKNLGAFGDGGFVTTNSARVEKSVRLYRNIGRNGWYKHPIKGYNSRLDTIQAAILLEKLKHLPDWTQQRIQLANRYSQSLQNLPIVLPKQYADRTHVFHLYVVRTKKRKLLLQYLLDNGINASIHYPIPIHKQKAYIEHASTVLPISETIAKEVVSLPFFVGMTENEQEYVCATIKKFFTLH